MHRRHSACVSNFAARSYVKRVVGTALVTISTVVPGSYVNADQGTGGTVAVIEGKRAAVVPSRYKVLAVGGSMNGAPSDINNRGQILLTSGEILSLMPDGVISSSQSPDMNPRQSLLRYPGNGFRLAPMACAMNDRGDIIYWKPDGIYLHTADSDSALIVSRRGERAMQSERRPQSIAETLFSLNNNLEAIVRASIPYSDRISHLYHFRWRSGNLENIGVKYAEWEKHAESKRQKMLSRCIVMDSNDFGCMAGHLDTVPLSANARAVLIDKEEQMHPLQPLQGADQSFGYGLNNHSQVVGYSLSQRGDVATLWHNGAPIDLNARIPSGTGWQLNRAIRINDNGVIIGRGMLNGVPQSFVLLPIYDNSPG